MQAVSIDLVNRNQDIDCRCVRSRLCVLVAVAGVAMPSALVGGASAPSLCFSGSAGRRDALAPLLEVSRGGTAEGDSANLAPACTLMVETAAWITLYELRLAVFTCEAQRNTAG